MTAVTSGVGGRSAFDNIVGRAKAGIKTTGDLVILSVESARFIATDIVARRFSWSEFLLQCWFMTRVSLLPTILVSIPFGVITSVQIGAARQPDRRPRRSSARSTASACSARVRRW